MLKQTMLYVIRFLVGGLFIFSGLIKVNDPVGTAIKLEEYFDVFSNDIASFFSIFKDYALEIAVFLVVAEVVLGVMLILGVRLKLTVWALGIMILFFTFLTFYSAYFNKVTDCGCFGDAEWCLSRRPSEGWLVPQKVLGVEASGRWVRPVLVFVVPAYVPLLPDFAPAKGKVRGTSGPKVNGP